MNERLTIIIRKQSRAVVHTLVAIPVVMVVGSLALPPLLRLALPALSEQVRGGIMGPVMIACMFGTLWFTALRRQGTLIVEGDRIIVSVLFRKRKVFHRARTRFSLHPMLMRTSSAGNLGGMSVMGAMLVFSDDSQELRLGFVDWELGKFLDAAEGAAEARLAQVRVTAQDFLQLAKHLDVEVPLPPDWRLPPKGGLV